MAILPKAIYRFNATPVKIPTELFIDLERTILNFIRKNKKPSIAKTILNNETIAGDVTVSDFKLYCRTLLIKTS